MAKPRGRNSPALQYKKGSSQATVAGVTDILIDALRDRNHQKCVDALVELLVICKNKSDPRHWKPPRHHVSEKLLKTIRLLLVDREKPVRIQAARALRYLMWNKAVLKEISRLNIPVFICLCLERDQQGK